MTRATGQVSDGFASVSQQSRTMQTGFVPAVALCVTLALAQQSGIALRQIAADGQSSAQLTTVAAQRDLFDELLRFHHRLAAAQTDLPKDAARVLTENLWQLYE